MLVLGWARASASNRVRFMVRVIFRVRAGAQAGASVTVRLGLLLELGRVLWLVLGLGLV